MSGKEGLSDAPDPSMGPPDEDLKKILAERGGMKWTPLTIALVAVLVLGAGFLGGLIVGRHHAGTAAATGPNLPGGGNFPGGGQGFPGGGAGAGNGDVTVGTVESVSGDTLEVRTSSGDLIKVTTDSGTQVQVTKSGALSDLTSGANVVVVGTADGDGAVAATSINSGGAFGGFGGGAAASNAPPPSLSP